MPPDSDPNKRSGHKQSKTQSTSAEGTSWFLGIGINDYQHFPPLRNAVKDVKDVVRVLQDRYDVATENTITIFDKEATRRNIIRSLDRLQRKVGPKDKLIIYYSGHGHLNKSIGKGYWIPTDAEQDDTATYIRNSTVREYIDDIKSLHTLLISDSCFSGALFVRGMQRSSAAIQELASIPSRWALCSGRHDEEVYDGKPGENSPFVESIIDTLRDNQRTEYNVIKLIDRIVEQTRSNYEQMPEGNPLFGVGHKGGQYIFRLRADEEEYWLVAVKKGTTVVFQQYLDQYPEGKYTKEAQNKLLELQEEAAWKKASDTHTINAFIKYRRDYPSGLYRDEALAAIRILEENEGWNLAKRRNSIFEYEQYLEKYPSGKYKKEAVEKLDALLQKKNDAFRVQEDKAWQDASKKDNKASYKTYLQRYPFGRFAEQAKRRIQQLEQAEPKTSIPKSEIPVQRQDQVQMGKPRKKVEKVKPIQWKKAYNWPLILGLSSIFLIWIFIQFVFPLFYQTTGNGIPENIIKKEEISDEGLTTLIKELESDMVSVNGGTFTMGCLSEERDGDCFDNEQPAHEVTLDDFYIGRYELKQAQWRAVMGSDPRGLYNKGCDDCPVESVSWNDIQDFLQQLNKLTGQNYRLPTEAEWEFAARGGNQSQRYLYSGSNDIDEVGWHSNNSNSKTHPVGDKKANELGLYDMSGNVWEWCQDWFGNYSSAAQQNPKGPESGSERVFCGGSWEYGSQGCRAAYRGYGEPTYRYYGVGFRLALSSR